MLGSGFISDFYTETLHAGRNSDRVLIVQSRSEENGKRFAQKFNIPRWTTSMEDAINDPEIDTVVIGLPNNLHKDPVLIAAAAGKAVLCTKPLARTAIEAKEMLDAVEKAGVFHGYLEDLVYTPKSIKALKSVKEGALGRILWARSREAHPGPHSSWFWDKSQSGGGAILDLGCHCIEISRSYIGKDIRPVEAVCWADTLVKPIEAEDNAVGLVRYENGAIGQFEVSWSFRGGMDLRDEVSGTEGTIWINNFLRTGFEMFTAPGQSGYVAEKAETDSGWLFPVGDERVELGYVDMFLDMFESVENGQEPVETFYDGYVVNAIMDACYKSARTKRWEPIELEIWRGKDGVEKSAVLSDYDEEYYLVKEEILPDGRVKVILKDKNSSNIIEK